jgi:hypothetical protein
VSIPNESMSWATIEERLRRGDELRAGRPDRQVATGRPRTRGVRRAALRMALMRLSRGGGDVVVPADAGEGARQPTRSPSDTS